MKKTNFGKVIKILNDKTIAIDVGSEELAVGEFINVLDKSVEITDPVTGKILGDYVFKKAKLRIKETHDFFSIAEAYKTEAVNNTLAIAMNPLLRSSKRIVPLNVNKDDNDNINLESLEIRLGDEISKVESSH